MTISSRGITYYNDGEYRYMTLQQWEHEVELFEKIRKIFFFEKFRVWKKFFLWKKAAWRGYFTKCSEIIEEKLFHADKFFRTAMLKVNHHCYEI